jgi:hypothetical protein
MKQLVIAWTTELKQDATAPIVAVLWVVCLFVDGDWRLRGVNWIRLVLMRLKMDGCWDGEEEGREEGRKTAGTS